jgi:hypothetical protein
MEKQKHRDSSTRRLPGPASCRLGKGPTLLRLITNCFGTGRAHKLNHLRWLDRLRQQIDVRSCRMQAPPAVRHSCAAEASRSARCALSGARPETPCFSLDIDLHRGRQLAPSGVLGSQGSQSWNNLRFPVSCPLSRSPEGECQLDCQAYSHWITVQGGWVEAPG